MIVRTTLRPDHDIEVSPAEYLDLSRQGLIAETPSVSHADAEPAQGTTDTKAAPAAATEEG